MNIKPKNNRPPDTPVIPAGTPMEEGQWLNIAEGIEKLERMLRAETDPKRQDVIWHALGEAKCI